MSFVTNTYDPASLRDHIIAVCGLETYHIWFEPLFLNFVNENNALYVDFPHRHFGSWFMQEKTELFAQLVNSVFPGLSVIYNFDRQASTVVAPAPDGLFEEHSMQPKAVISPQIALPEHTFASFLVNKKNDFPVAVARRLSDNALSAEFVIIYGQSGTGKTHLLEAVINGIRASYSRVSIFYGCIEEFFQEMGLPLSQEAGSNKQVYCIDDVQRVQESSHSQRMLSRHIDALQRGGKTIILTFDSHPAENPELQQRLKQRLSSALVVELKKPDLDIRRRYIQSMNTEFSLGLDMQETLSIAKWYQDFRTITGALTRVKAYRLLVDSDQPIDLESMLGPHDQDEPLSLQHIARCTASFFSVDLEKMLGKSREKELVLPRQIAVYLCRELLGLSLIQIGEFFGGRDHSSIVYTIKKIKKMQTSDKVMHNTVSQLKKMCLSPGNAGLIFDTRTTQQNKSQ